ncbi:MAG: radical SAM protein [Terriglobales bacterium]|jgi:MoaA/NifB/PqqE/SkfB family radical SAM enzyme
MSAPEATIAGTTKATHLLPSAHSINSLPVVVLSPHNQCNCRCLMCDIWKIRESKQITPALLEAQLDSFRRLGVRWVVLSGGEPQRNPQLCLLAGMLHDLGIRVTLLTAGTLLSAQAELLAAAIDDVIVSLDGPAPVHNRIRRIPRAFERLMAGVQALRHFRPEIVVRARCTVQRENHAWLRATVQSAKDHKLNSISFLAVDAVSDAFNHPQGRTQPDADSIILDGQQIGVLEKEMEELIDEYGGDLHSGFVVETAEKLRRIVQQFRVYVGQAQPVAPRCNAPWVSAVVGAEGEVRPCFFHPALGNLHDHSLQEIVNSPQALRFRNELDIASNPICRRCVCSLHLTRKAEDPARGT